MNTLPVLQRLEVDFTAKSIMTPSADFKKATADADLSNLVLPEHADKYDVIPIVCGDEIIGVYTNQKAGALTRDWLISQDTPIANLPGLLARPERPGFFVLHGPDIVGIVTHADLNDVPARVFCYELLAHLELALEAWIRLTFKGDQRDLVALLGEGEGERGRELFDDYEKQEQTDVEIDYVELFYLPDLFNVLERHGELRAKLGFASATQVHKATSGINDLRNSIMHPVRPVVIQGAGQEGVAALHRRVERVKRLIEQIGEHSEQGA